MHVTKYEKEADRVVDEVMRMPDPTVSKAEPADIRASGSDSRSEASPLTIQRMCTDCAIEDDDKLRRKSLADNTPALPPISAPNGPVAARFPLANRSSVIQRMKMDDEDNWYLQSSITQKRRNWVMN